MSLGKRRRKLEISAPSNFQHRLHTSVSPAGYIGLPKQWTHLVSQEAVARSHHVRQVPKGDSQEETVVKARSYYPGLEQEPRDGPGYDLENVRAANLERARVLSLQQGGPGEQEEVVRKRLEGLLVRPAAGVRLGTRGLRPEQGAGVSNPLYSVLQEEGRAVPRTVIREERRGPEEPGLSHQELVSALSLVVIPGDPRPLLKDWTFLARGSTASVHSAHCPALRRRVAVKQLSLRRHQRRELLFNEVVMLREFRHSNVVSLLDCHLVGEELWVVMEFMAGGCLTDIVTEHRLEEGQVASVAAQLLPALAFLHSLGVIHRDLKSDSVLLTLDGVAKLSDFGFCAQVHGEVGRRRSLVGTPYWMAPEVICRRPYGTAADIWSLGILVFELLLGQPPHFDEPPLVAMRRVRDLSPPRLPAELQVSEGLRGFLARCLVKDPADREDAATLVTHPFIKTAPGAEVLKEVVECGRQAVAKVDTRTGVQK